MWTPDQVRGLEAGAVVVRVEECELLLAMHGIVGIVDVEHDCSGRSREASAIEIDLAEPYARQRTPVGQVLEPGQRRLAHQIAAAVGCAADGDLQGGIGTQRVDVIAVLVAGGDHDHPRHRHLGVAVPYPARIAIVAERPGDRLGQPQALGDLAQHDDAAVRRKTPGIEGGCECLALDG